MPPDDAPEPTSELPNWNQIVDKHAERVGRIAYRILGSAHDAEDVSQEVFQEAMLMHRKGPVRSWTGLMVRLATLRSPTLSRVSAIAIGTLVCHPMRTQHKPQPGSG